MKGSKTGSHDTLSSPAWRLKPYPGMWYLLSWQLTLKWTKLVLFLTFSHLISKSNGLYDPDVTSWSLYCAPRGHSLKNRAFFNFMNVLDLAHATQSQSGHLEDKSRDSCVAPCVGVGSKVSSQVKIRYTKVLRKTKLPFLNMPSPATGFPSCVRRYSFSLIEH